MSAASLTLPAAPAERTNLLGLPRRELEAFVAQLGSQPFRARQLLNWMYKRGVGSFAEMTDLAKDLRARLAEVAEVRAPEILAVRRSSDGTSKWLLRAEASAAAPVPGAAADERRVTNVVLMGMGEPLANFRNVVPALSIFLDDFGFDLSRRRVTLSTSGLVPQIYRLARE